jgi:hypothetical protein
VGYGFVDFSSRGLVHVFSAGGAGGAVLLAREHRNLDRKCRSKYYYAVSTS